jgi:outer membrane protein TolC
VRQPIFTGFVLSSTYRLAELGVDLSELDVELEKLNLALRVKEAYFNILGADRLVEVARSAVESIEANVNVARNFYEVGMNPINEVLKAEVELGNAKQNLIKSMNAARLSRSAFNTVLVKPITSPVEVEDILTYQPETGGFDAYVTMALERRPEIRTIDVNIEQVDQQKRLARGGYYPQVALGYDYIKEGDTYAVDGSGGRNANSWQVTATATWTFWEWGKTHYSVREQDSAERQLLATRKELEDQIRLQVQEAIFALEEAEMNIPTTKKAVVQGEENLRVNEERYRAQVQTITEVLDAQTLLSQARVNYYQALYDHNLARFRLQRAIGSY